MPGTEHGHISQADILFRRKPEVRFSNETNFLLATAIQDGHTRLSHEAGEKAREKVTKGLVNRLGPYVEEISILAGQRELQRYKDSKEQTATYLRDVRVAALVCSDRRIGASGVTLGTLHRRPGGVAELRESTANPDKKEYVMDDYRIGSAIASHAEIQKEKGKKPKCYEKIVVHIDCAAGKKAAIKKAEDEGRPEPTKEELEMQSIEGLFETLREPMSGFNTDIKRAGGEGLTVISLFDIHTQGEAYGLEYVYDEKKARGEKLFDRSKPVQENLEEWEKDKKILRTKTLDEILLRDNPDFAAIKRLIDTDKIHALDLKAPEQHADAAIQIANMTQALTERYEESKDGFTWIPESIRSHIEDDDLLRALAFDMIRNSVRRILGSVQPGENDQHKEVVTRIGSAGGALNEQTPALIISTHGVLRKQDKDAANVIIPLQAKVAKDLGINLEEEARVVIVTEEYDKDDYNPTKPEVARKAKYDAMALAKQNAAIVRGLFPDEVKNGDIVVIAALHDRSRRMSEVLTSLPQDQTRT